MLPSMVPQLLQDLFQCQSSKGKKDGCWTMNEELAMSNLTKAKAIFDEFKIGFSRI